MTAKLLACGGALALLLAAAPVAHAQTTVHKLDLTLKSVAQGSSGMDLRPLKGTGHSADVFEVCTGDPPVGHQGLFLFLDCNLAGNQIVAYDPDMGTGTGIGNIELDTGHEVISSKNEAIKTAIIPFNLDIECGKGAFVTASGILDVTFAKLGDANCPSALKGKVTGTGDSPQTGPFIVDDGSSFSAKKGVEAVK